MGPLVPMAVEGGAGLLDYLLGGEERKQQKQLFGEKMNVIAMLKAALANQNQDVISPGQMSQMSALNTQGMMPTMNRIAGAAGRFSGMRSPETYRMIGQQTAPITADFLKELMFKNIAMKQQRNQFYTGALARLV